MGISTRQEARISPHHALSTCFIVLRQFRTLPPLGKVRARSGGGGGWGLGRKLRPYFHFCQAARISTTVGQRLYEQRKDAELKIIGGLGLRFARSVIDDGLGGGQQQRWKHR